MRIKHFFGLAVIAAMTASCSSNNDLVNGGNGSGENESGVSYASITINLPTANGTRATTNDQFDGGTASEYAVNDATLVIFEKGTAAFENDFKFVEAVPLGNLEPWKKDNESNNGITQQKQPSQLSSRRLQLVRMAIIMHWSSLIRRQEQETKLPFLQVPLHMELGMLRQMQQTF